MSWQKLGTYYKINVFWFQNDLRINCQTDGQFCGLVWVKVVFFCAFAASQFSMGFLADRYGNWRVMKHTVKYLIILFFPLCYSAQKIENIFGDKTELYFSFDFKSKSKMDMVSKLISIDHKSSKEKIYAYANKTEFSELGSIE